MKTKIKTPNPGSDEAIDMGCTCPVLDNAYGKGGYMGGFFINENCPIHTIKKKAYIESEGYVPKKFQKKELVSDCPKKCKYCRDNYKSIISKTKKIKPTYGRYAPHKNMKPLPDCPKKCPYCKADYNSLIGQTSKLKNKKVRQMLMDVWETLWLNNSQDLDIIENTFDFEVFK